ncbi:MAG: hypothetical protein QOD55_2164 [Solirubrobacteraceae bacterium]|nr:hypothetical protein [Solirubrobacteraceae bacterium]MEA2290167.1 hypothetical protein [Solirubrobacteraceae bacterium]
MGPTIPPGAPRAAALGKVAAVSDGSSTLTAPRSVTATRYVTPLREGGSMPGLVEADDDGLYVLKFRGAGQGPRALIAELVAGELGRALGLDVPEIVLIHLDPDLGRAEPDPEIQELIASSGGRNVGLDFLPAALPFVAGAGSPPPPDVAAAVVWFDALMTNVDRTPRNPNLLCWHGRLWLIDHGAALYLQHGADDLPTLAHRPFPLIREHVLLPYAGSIAEADARLAPLLTPALVESVVTAVPAEWLAPTTRGEPGDGEDAARRAYVEYLLRRLETPRGFVEEADGFRRAA